MDEAITIVSDFLQTLAPVSRGRPPSQGSRVPLTPRQIEVLRLVAAGMGILAPAGLVRLIHQKLRQMNRIRLDILATTKPVVNLANQDHLSIIAQALHP